MRREEKRREEHECMPLLASVAAMWIVPLLTHPTKYTPPQKTPPHQVKKAYMQLVDGERRAWCLQTINETRKRTLKERRQKLAKGAFVVCGEVSGLDE